MAELSSIRIGGTVSLAAFPQCKNELIFLLSLCHGLGCRYHLVGRGTNILFPDGHLDAVLISTCHLDRVTVAGERVTADCGVTLPYLSALAARHALTGLEFAAGIPGTLGGALVMNAGAFGGEIADVVREIEAYDVARDRLLLLSPLQAGFSYRESRFQSGGLAVLGATLSLDAGEITAIREKMSANLERRRATQPVEPSAGSVFRRPAPDIAMGRVIEELGLKGRVRGGAAISEKHAGFIVNKGGATAADVTYLIDTVVKITEKERGFRPQLELRLIE